LNVFSAAGGAGFVAITKNHCFLAGFCATRVGPPRDRDGRAWGIFSRAGNNPAE
jgi:hypothetical protein